MSRIVAGRYGGRRLVTPPGRDTRPTAEVVREALFSTLESMCGLTGRRVLDLFAGSGALGLEAASRGAAAVLLVEADPVAARSARANIETLGAAGTVQVLCARVQTVLAAASDGPGYDLVLADPPYQLAEARLTEVLQALVGRDWLAADAVLAVERSSRSPEPDWPTGLTGERSRRYGQTMLWYGRRS